MKRDDDQQREKELQQLRDRWEQKAEERERMLGLFRRGRIDAETLDKHLDAIDTEGAELHREIESMSRSLSAADQTAQLKSAEGLLAALRKRLDGRISAELKRRLVEALVENIRADTVECWGVAQSRVTVTYRFAQPGEAAPLVLPRAHELGGKTRPPEKLETIGDHLRRRRLTLKLIQKQVAAQIGVDKTSIHNWETNVSKPGFKYMPAIIRFLGYNPVLPGDDWGERLVQCRTALGLSQKQSAARLGVDPSTLARWERGERKPVGKFAERVMRLFNEVADRVEVAQTA